jgi:hypothetical protein
MLEKHSTSEATPQPVLLLIMEQKEVYSPDC